MLGYSCSCLAPTVTANPPSLLSVADYFHHLDVNDQWAIEELEMTDRATMAVLTANGTRDLSDALRRRCMYAYVEYPDRATEIAILAARCPEVEAHLAGQIVGFVQSLRKEDLDKKPGVAEMLDFAAALSGLGINDLTSDPAILQASSYWKPGDPVVVNSLPDRTGDWLLERKRETPRATKIGGDCSAHHAGAGPSHLPLRVSSLRLGKAQRRLQSLTGRNVYAYAQELLDSLLAVANFSQDLTSMFTQGRRTSANLSLCC